MTELGMTPSLEHAEWEWHSLRYSNRCAHNSVIHIVHKNFLMGTWATNSFKRLNSQILGFHAQSVLKLIYLRIALRLRCKFSFPRHPLPQSHLS